MEYKSLHTHLAPIIGITVVTKKQHPNIVKTANFA
jgi:hypothetical protein